MCMQALLTQDESIVNSGNIRTNKLENSVSLVSGSYKSYKNRLILRKYKGVTV